MFKYDLLTKSDNICKFIELSITHERVRLPLSQQMLRFMGKGTVLTSLLTAGRVYLHQIKISAKMGSQSKPLEFLLLFSSNNLWIEQSMLHFETLKAWREAPS